MRLKRVWVLMFIWIGLFFMAIPARGVEIIAFGDSITKGFPYVEEKSGDGRRVGGYEPTLESLFKNAGAVPAYVYNYGVGGEDTYWGARRFDDVLDEHPNADYVLILEGTNDDKLFSVGVTIHYLRSMIGKCQKRGIQAVLGTLLPDTGHGEEKERLIRTSYNPRIKALAEETNTPLADFYSAMASKWSSLTHDGTHPNRSGYRVMANVWFDVLNAPAVTTLPAESVDVSVAVVNGIINPNHLPTSYYFEYGYNTDYGGKTPVMDAGSGKDEISVSASLGDLSENTVYHYRLVAYNALKTLAGGDLTFQTTEGSSSSGCFIATAAFGSALEPRVQVLKNFRDQFLLKTPLGRWFVSFYYRHSPPIAGFIEQHPLAKKLVRMTLYPLVGIGTFMVNTSALIQAVCAGSVLFGIFMFSYWRIRNRRQRDL